MKYVLSNTQDQSDWKNTTFLKNVEDIKKLKDSDGSELHVWGSGKLIQLLLKNDLVDELRLVTYPLTLGQGQKLFEEGTIPAAFKLIEGKISPTGVIMANYKRAGEVKTGTVGE
jgi:dihydrofolate reductase